MIIMIQMLTIQQIKEDLNCRKIKKENSNKKQKNNKLKFKNLHNLDLLLKMKKYRKKLQNKKNNKK